MAKENHLIVCTPQNSISSSPQSRIPSMVRGCPFGAQGRPSKLMQCPWPVIGWPPNREGLPCRFAGQPSGWAGCPMSAHGVPSAIHGRPSSSAGKAKRPNLITNYDFQIANARPKRLDVPQMLHHSSYCHRLSIVNHPLNHKSTIANLKSTAYVKNRIPPNSRKRPCGLVR